MWGTGYTSTKGGFTSLDQIAQVPVKSQNLGHSPQYQEVYTESMYIQMLILVATKATIVSQASQQIRNQSSASGHVKVNGAPPVIFSNSVDCQPKSELLS